MAAGERIVMLISQQGPEEMLLLPLLRAGKDLWWTKGKASPIRPPLGFERLIFIFRIIIKAEREKLRGGR